MLFFAIFSFFTLVVAVLTILWLYFENMAIILYSALISTIRGKLQGSVFSKSGAGQVITNRGVPRREPTAAQLTARSGFSVNASLWLQLGEVQRLAWTNLAATIPVQNRIGETVFLTGFLYFRKVMSLIFPAGSNAPFLADPAGGVAQESEFVMNEFSLDTTNQGWRIVLADLTGITTNATGAEQHIIISISLPISPGQRTYFGTYYRALTQVFNGPNQAGQSFNIQIVGFIMPIGWYTFTDAVHRFRIQFVQGNSGSISVEKFADIVSSFAPPTVFPQVQAYNGTIMGRRPRWNWENERIEKNMHIILGDGTVDFNSIFRSVTRIGTPAGSQVPIDPTLLGPNNTFSLDLYSPASGNRLTGGVPIGTLGSYMLEYFGTFPTSQIGKFLPVSIILQDIATGTESEPTYIYFEITASPVVFPTLTVGVTNQGEGEFVWIENQWFAIPWFIASPVLPNFETIYEISLQFSTPISGPDVSPITSWGPARVQSFDGPYDTNYFASPGPPGDGFNDALIKSAAPPPYNFGPSPHMPTRIQLIHIPTGEVGPFQVGASPIVVG